MLVLKIEKIVDGTICINRKINKRYQSDQSYQICIQYALAFSYCVASTYFQYLNVETYT